MNFSTLSELLDTTTNMTQIRNTTNSTTTDQLVGAAWFKFKGVVCNNIFIDRTNYVGFGSNTNHLGVCVRAGQIMAIYRQEGTVGINETKFLKFRIEASTRSGYTTSTYTLTYEVFLLDTQDIFLNVIKTPTSSSYIGVSTFDGTSLSIAINSTPKISFYADSRGIVYEVLVLPAYAIRYLIESGSDVFSEKGGTLTNLGPIELTATVFSQQGATNVPTSASLKSLSNPKVLYWQDSGDELPTLQANVNALPPIQTIEHDVDMNHPSIQSIKSVSSDFVGLPLIAFSKDGVLWQHYNGTAWIDGFGQIPAHTGPILETWRAGAKTFKIQVRIGENDALKLFKIQFQN